MCDWPVVAAVRCRTARQRIGTAVSAVVPARLLAAAHGVSVRSACFTPVGRCVRLWGQDSRLPGKHET